jgi:hypothetical protein
MTLMFGGSFGEIFAGSKRADISSYICGPANLQMLNIRPLQSAFRLVIRVIFCFESGIPLRQNAVRNDLQAINSTESRPPQKSRSEYCSLCRAATFDQRVVQPAPKR